MASLAARRSIAVCWHNKDSGENSGARAHFALAWYWAIATRIGLERLDKHGLGQHVSYRTKIKYIHRACYVAVVNSSEGPGLASK